MVKLKIQIGYFDNEIINYFGNITSPTNVLISLVIMRKHIPLNLGKIFKKNKKMVQKKYDNKNSRINVPYYPIGKMIGCFRFRATIDLTHDCPTRWFHQCKNSDGVYTKS